MSAQPLVTIPLTQSQLQLVMAQGFVTIPGTAINVPISNSMTVPVAPNPPNSTNAISQLVIHSQSGAGAQAAMSQPTQTQQPTQDQPEKKKRTLNCFVAFRCYISPIFQKFQQKERSGLVKVMWAVEMVKAKWTIIAKAYSVIRDEVGSENAPMDAFLNLACPHIGIISRENYLSTLGWEFVNTGSGWQLNRRFIPGTDDLPQGYLTTTLSVDDMIQFVRSNGYGIAAQTAASSAGSSNNTGGSTLAMAAQPVQPAQPTQAAVPPAQTIQATIQPAQQAQQAQPSSNLTQIAPTYQMPHVHQPQPFTFWTAQQAHPGAQPTMHPVPNDVAFANLQRVAQTGEVTVYDRLTHALVDGTDEDQLAQILNLDPDPSDCTTTRMEHAHPTLFDMSTNAQLNGNELRPYFPMNDSRLKFIEIAPEKSDTMEVGEKAFQKLACDLWEKDSEYPHGDQFIPGRHYSTFGDYEREVMPDYDAFDMHRLAHVWPTDESYDALLSQNQG
ncbi:mat1-1-1 [Diplodia corticola]|uniref:Mating-type protein MAT-1 n=4 Tax=Diplodia corticola TaxID=236234 RepID=A0A1J9R7H2_9PEZI|nr:mat1-1-1 [Diplodia corticola]OJD37486.1 mat1-1-1 [Diplodia corticola]